MSDSYRDWSSGLPKEILDKIGTHLDSRVDVYRFRAVCSSWRSSVPASYRLTTAHPIKLPKPTAADAFFSQVSICSLQRPVTGGLPWSTGLSKEALISSTPSAAIGVTKVEESTRGKMQLLSPLSNHQIAGPYRLQKYTNMLEFRLVELERAYTLKLARGCSVFGISKALLHQYTSASWVDANSRGYGLLALIHEGKLGYWRFGDDEWTLLDKQNFHYDDIIAYKGQFYVVDRCGVVWWIDSGLNLVQYAPPLFGCGEMKNLVHSCGDLYVIDRYLDGERRARDEDEDTRIYLQMNSDIPRLYRWNYHMHQAHTVDVKVYKLDEEWGTWVDVSSLGDRVFILGHECSFSISAADFPGAEGNCIYFSDPVDVDLKGELSGHSARVFRFVDHRIEKASFFIDKIGEASSLVSESPLFWQCRMQT